MNDTTDRGLVIYAELTGLIEDLERASDRTAEQVTTQVIHSMADETATLARRYAPRDTGHLASSIAVYKGPLEASVRAEAPYAAFVEFGTWSHSLIDPKPGTYTIRPKDPDGVLRFETKTREVVYTRKVEHPGIKPQPFMNRAADEVTDNFSERIGDVAMTLITGETD